MQTRKTTALTLQALLGLSFLMLFVACQDNYRPNGLRGDPCGSDNNCAAGLSCNAFVCSEGNGDIVTQPRPPTTDTSTLGFDSGNPGDTNVRLDTDPLSDTDPFADTDPLSDTETFDTDTPDIPPPRDTSVSSDTAVPPRDTSNPPDTDPPDLPTNDAQVCTPLERLCRDNTAELVCRPDGSGFVFRSCSNNEVCINDRCTVQAICDPGSVRCQGNEVQVCTNDGTRWLVEQICRGNDICSAGRCTPNEVELPNLTILSFEVELRTYQPGELLGIFGDISNTGTRNTGSFSCSAWLSLDRQIDPNIDILGVGPYTLPNLGPGDSFPFSIDLLEIPLSTPPGDYYVIGECDALEAQVVESNENDNIAIPRGRITVRNDVVLVCEEDPFEAPFPNPLPEGFYDLALCDESDAYIIQMPEAGRLTLDLAVFEGVPEQILLLSIVQNETGQTIDTFELFNFEPLQISWSLPAGTYTIELSRIFEASARYTLGYRIDLDDGQPDLSWIFSEVAAEPGLTVFPGDELFWFGLFENIGRQDITSEHTLEVYLSEVPEQTPDSILVERFILPRLFSGEAIDLESVFLIPEDIQTGPQFVIFVLDARNQIAETNEFNNTFVWGPLFVENEVALQCEDELEPNSRSNPLELGAGSYDDLWTCTPRNDFYRFCLEPRQRLDINLSFLHRQGDVDINILNNEGVELTGSYGTDNREFVSIASGFEETCFIAEVYVCCGGESNQYDMDVAITDIEPIPECDEFEPNDTIDNAISIFSVFRREDLALCPERDVDIYFFDSDEGQRWFIGASADAEINFRVYDSNFVEFGSDSGINPEVRFEATREGPYFIEITQRRRNPLIFYSLFRIQEI